MKPPEAVIAWRDEDGVLRAVSTRMLWLYPPSGPAGFWEVGIPRTSDVEPLRDEEAASAIRRITLEEKDR